MKAFLVLAVTFLISNVALADTKGEAVYSEYRDTGSLLLKGKIAEKMYNDLQVRPVREQIDVDIIAMRKPGKNVQCYSRTDRHEFQCVLFVYNRASGAVVPASEPTENR